MAVDVLTCAPLLPQEAVRHPDQVTFVPLVDLRLSGTTALGGMPGRMEVPGAGGGGGGGGGGGAAAFVAAAAEARFPREYAEDYGEALKRAAEELEQGVWVPPFVR